MASLGRHRANFSQAATTRSRADAVALLRRHRRREADAAAGPQPELRPALRHFVMIGRDARRRGRAAVQQAASRRRLLHRAQASCGARERLDDRVAGLERRPALALGFGKHLVERGVVGAIRPVAVDLEVRWPAACTLVPVVAPCQVANIVAGVDVAPGGGLFGRSTPSSGQAG